MVDFLPSNYYDYNLEGVNTDLLVVAALLNKYDSFLYSSMEEKTGSMIFFLTPVYKWLVDLFSNPFDLAFTRQLLDLLFCVGNWALVLAALSLIIQSRKEFIACGTMEDVSNVFARIPEQLRGDAVYEAIQRVYEMCLMGNM